MNIADFFTEVSQLKGKGWAVGTTSNVVWFRHSSKAPSNCDSITAVYLEKTGATREQLEGFCLEIEFEYTAAARLLGLDWGYLGPLINPSEHPGDPVSLGLLEAMFGNAKQAMAKIRSHREEVPVPSSPVTLLAS